MLNYYYEDKFKIFKLHAKLHARIVLYKHNYYNHIKAEHPEVSIKIIIAILEEPDFVYKMSITSKDYFYEKKIDEGTYRIVITGHKKHVKNVVTAYKLKYEDDFDIKHTYCLYDKNATYEHIEISQEEDINYFLKLFEES